MPLLENFTLNLREAMEEKGITTIQLATKAKLHRVTVSRILHGHLMPTLETCEKLANAAGMRADTAFLEPLEKK